MILRLALLCALPSLAQPASEFIHTLIGVSAVDGVPALSLALSFPQGLATDLAGNYYLSDTGNHRVIKVDAATGLATAVAGTGSPGYGGDGGPATQAALNSPMGLSFGYVTALGSHCLFIADSRNHRIRLVNLQTGAMSTAAGAGVGGYGGDGGPAGSALLFEPQDVAVRGVAGEMLIADTQNHRVRYGTVFGNISTVAGLGVPSFTADGPIPTASGLPYPSGVAFGPGSSFFIASSGRIRMVSSGITTVAGVSPFPFPGALVSLAGLHCFQHPDLASWTLLATEQSGSKVLRLSGSSAGQPITGTVRAGNGLSSYAGDGGPPLAAAFNRPAAVTLDAFGNTLIADTFNYCIRKIARDTGLLSTNAGLGGAGGLPGTSTALGLPSDLLQTPAGLLVSDEGQGRIYRLDPDSGIAQLFAGNGSFTFSGDNAAAALAGIHKPTALAKDDSGNVYFAAGWLDSADAQAGEVRIRKVDASGNISAVAGAQGGYSVSSCNTFTPPQSAASAEMAIIRAMAWRQGSLYFGQVDGLYDNCSNLPIRRLDLGTGNITSYAGNGATVNWTSPGPFPLNAILKPEGLAFDAAGFLYVADAGQNAVFKVSPGGLSATVLAGLGASNPGYGGDGGPAYNAALFKPSGVEVAENGDVTIADRGNHRIRVIRAGTGKIETVAGTGFAGVGGDGGPPLLAQLYSPRSPRLLPGGAYAWVDQGSTRVREVRKPSNPQPTPVEAREKRVAAYPSPAASRICFSFKSPRAGRAEVLIYNAAFKLAAKFEEQVGLGQALVCADVSTFATGPYIYRLSVEGEAFPLSKFKVAR